jgi:hypothetical protein
MWISIPSDRIRGLDASPGGIPTTTSSFGLKYVLGCLESVARALGHVRAHPGSSLTLLLEGSCRTLVEGQLSLPRGLYRARGPFPRYLGISVRGSLPGPLAGRVFWGRRDRRDSERRGIRLRCGGRPRARLLRDVRKRLGGRI